MDAVGRIHSFPGGPRDNIDRSDSALSASLSRGDSTLSALSDEGEHVRGPGGGPAWLESR